MQHQNKTFIQILEEVNIYRRNRKNYSSKERKLIRAEFDKEMEKASKGNDIGLV